MNMSEEKNAITAEALEALILDVKCGKKEKVVRQWFHARYCQDPANVQFPKGKVHDIKRLFDADTDGFEIAYNSFNYTINTKIKDALVAEGVIEDEDAVSINLTSPTALAESGAPSLAPAEINIQDDIKDIKDMDFGTYACRKTGKVFDVIASDLDEDGGVYPGVYIAIGESGVGKTTILLDAIKSAQLEKLKDMVLDWWKEARAYLSVSKNAQKKLEKPVRPTLADAKQEIKGLYISSEMTKDDLWFALQKQKDIGEVQTLLLMDYFKGGMDIALQQAFSFGYDFIVFDSYQDTIVKMIDVLGWKPRAAGTFLINLMLDGASAGAAIFAIQHMTKGGQYAGGTFLKHCTTGMLEVRHASDGTRYVSWIKNRRGGSMTGIPIHYKLNTATGDIEYDERRLMNDLKKKEDAAFNDEVMEELDEKFDETFFDQLDVENIEEEAKEELSEDETENVEQDEREE
jgi:hypothetical protein